MRVSRAQAAENRKRIVDTAARQFREGGIATTGVDAVMNAAGLTHGGFYTHFESKNKLAAEACSQSLAQSVEKWTKLAEGKEPFKAIVEHYLSARHRDHPADGCLIAALITEAPRSSPEVRQVISEGIKSLLGVLETTIPGRDKKAKRAKALSLFTAMVGALSMARAVDDPALSDEILTATKKYLTLGD
jgi:TetR/AcrR family transcriptional repressor of nem operon